MTSTVRDAESGGRTPRRHSGVRRGRYWLRRFVRSDTLLVTVLAIAMTLSAFAVYQATRAADESGDLLDQSRTLQSQAGREAGFLDTIVEHDLDVLRSICVAENAYAAASDSYFDETPDIGSLVTADLALDGLRSLLLGDRDATCSAEAGSGYSVERAAQRVDWFRVEGEGAATSTDEIAQQVAALNVSERLLMAAALLLAFVVAVIIAVDQLSVRGDRPRRITARTAAAWQDVLLVVGLVAGLVGTVLLLVFAVDPVVTALVVAGLGVAAAVEWWWLRRRRAPAATDAAQRGGRPQWWAEITGAVAIVAFSVSALGLSLAAIQENSAQGRADRQSAQSLALQRLGQQDMLRALASLSVIQDLEAREVAARQLAAMGRPEGDPDAVEELRLIAESELEASDDVIRAQTWRGVVGDEDCAVAEEPPIALVELYDTIRFDPDNALWEVVDRQTPSQICDMRAAMSRADAREWAGHGSLLTVALVVLGLAGFMLALAASADRSERTSRMLLGVGVGGLLVGVGLTVTPVMALVGGSGVPQDDDAQRIAEQIVYGPDESCILGTGLDGLDEAVAAFPDFGPALVARAAARGCLGLRHPWPALSSEMDPAVTADNAADVERAIDLGHATANTQGNLGWYLITRGIDTGDRGSVQRGLDMTRHALESLDEDAVGRASWAIFRFNEALALAVLGDRDGAAALYRDTVRCFDYAPRCPRDFMESGTAQDIRLWAIADLELIADDLWVDDYRRILLGIPQHPGRSPGARDDLTLELYPQEVRVVVGVDEEVPDAPSIWYYRPDDSYTWALLRLPTRHSMTGNGVDTAIPAGWLLGDGEYRADVYLNGRRIELHGTYEGGGDLTRVESTRIGVSAVVPYDWYVHLDDGVEWRVGPANGTNIVVRRVEGAAPEDVERYLADNLPPTDGREFQVDENGWFFGFQDIDVRRTEEADAYIASHLSPYAYGLECGGALFTASVDEDGSPVDAYGLFNSLLLERGPELVPYHGGVLAAAGVAVELPYWWDGISNDDRESGRLISAKDCTAGGVLDVSTETDFRSLRVQVDEVVAGLGAEVGHPDVVLESREPWEVEGAVDAELIVYSWADAGDAERAQVWQIVAKRGSTRATLTLTVPPGLADVYAEDRDIILPSLVLDGE